MQGARVCKPGEGSRVRSLASVGVEKKLLAMYRDYKESIISCRRLGTTKKPTSGACPSVAANRSAASCLSGNTCASGTSAACSGLVAEAAAIGGNHF